MCLDPNQNHKRPKNHITILSKQSSCLKYLNPVWRRVSYKISKDILWTESENVKQLLVSNSIIAIVGILTEKANV